MRRIFFFGILIAACRLAAQPSFAVEGYISSAPKPGTFMVDGRTVVLTQRTEYGPIGLYARSLSDPARQMLRVGTYVQVVGHQDVMLQIAASIVFVRDNRNEKISGFGVITRVISPAPEAVYEADGYSVRVTSSTRVDFVDSVNSLSDVGTNTWIQFSGKLNAEGVLEATHAKFIPGKPTAFKALDGIEVATVAMRPSAGAKPAATAGVQPSATEDGANLQEDQQLKVGLGRWHTIPADQPLQRRVHDVGMALVPVYQKQMADADPSKIHFRFYAVDNKGLRSAGCLTDGVILVSVQAIERLPNDDYLAAILADGIACQLQRQAARTVVDRRKELGIAAAEMLSPAAGIAFSAYNMASGEPNERFGEERLRIALALMHDAGYDPWLAPEAWRLLAQKASGQLGYAAVSG